MNVECLARVVCSQPYRHGVKSDNRLAHVTGRKLLGPSYFICQWHYHFDRYPIYPYTMLSVIVDVSLFTLCALGVGITSTYFK